MLDTFPKTCVALDEEFPIIRTTLSKLPMCRNHLTMRHLRVEERSGNRVSRSNSFVANSGRVRLDESSKTSGGMCDIDVRRDRNFGNDFDQELGGEGGEVIAVFGRRHFRSFCEILRKTRSQSFYGLLVSWACALVRLSCSAGGGRLEEEIGGRVEGKCLLNCGGQRIPS